MGYKFYLYVRNLFVVLGVTFLLIFINPVLKYVASANWLQTEGVITSAQWKERDSFLITMYQVTILFDYRVNGQLHHGTRINYGVAANTYLFERFANSVVARYPAGKTVTVFYNPTNFEDEIVERSPMGGFGLVWIFLALSFLVMSLVITLRKKEIEAVIDRPKVGSLRLRGRSGEEVIKDDYPSAVYNPPAHGDKKRLPPQEGVEKNLQKQ